MLFRIQAAKHPRKEDGIRDLFLGEVIGIEIHRNVGDPRRVNIIVEVADTGDGLFVKHFLLDLPLQVFAGQERNGLQGFLRFHGCLTLLQCFGGRHDVFELLVGETQLVRSELFCRCRIILFRQSLFRLHGDQDLMRILDDVLQEKAFEIAILDPIAKLFDVIDIAQCRHRVTVIEPEIHRAHAVEKSFRTSLIIVFTRGEFRTVQCGIEHILIDAVKSERAQRPVDDLGKLPLLLHFRACHLDGPDRLLVAVTIAAGQVASKAGIQDCFLQRCAVHIDQDIVQDTESERFLRRHMVACCDVESMDGLPLFAFLFCDPIRAGRRYPFLEAGLRADGRVHIAAVKMR